MAVADIKRVCAVLPTEFHHQRFMAVLQGLLAYTHAAVLVRPSQHALEVCLATLPRASSGQGNQPGFLNRHSPHRSASHALHMQKACLRHSSVSAAQATKQYHDFQT